VKDLDNRQTMGAKIHSQKDKSPNPKLKIKKKIKCKKKSNYKDICEVGLEAAPF